nr:NAD-dependent epimerase/dehydratase family protein [Antarctobacter heliothermus]
MVRTLWHPEGFSVVPVVRTGPLATGDLVWSPGDRLPRIAGVSAVVALWGVTPAPGRNLTENTHLALSAMEIGAALGADVVVHCSSAAVYRPDPNPIPETAHPEPGSAYGQAKLEMEQAISAHRSPGGPRQVVLRIGNVAGADSLFGNLKPGGRIILDRFPDGSGPMRSYIAPRDLVRGIEALIQAQDADGAYNISAPRPTGMAEIAGACHARVDWRAAPDGAAQMVWLDTNRLGGVVSLPPNAHTAAHLVQGARDSGVWT